MAEFGVELGGWTPPPWPGPMALAGRYARLEPLTPGHAAALFAANRADDAIWDYLPYGPFATEAEYAAWVTRMAGKPDPLFFAVTDLERGAPGGVASLMRIAPEAGSIEVGHICYRPGAAADARRQRGDLPLRGLGVPRGLSAFRVEMQCLEPREPASGGAVRVSRSRASSATTWW